MKDIVEVGNNNELTSRRTCEVSFIFIRYFICYSAQITKVTIL